MNNPLQQVQRKNYSELIFFQRYMVLARLSKYNQNQDADYFHFLFKEFFNKTWKSVGLPQPVFTFSESQMETPEQYGKSVWR